MSADTMAGPNWHRMDADLCAAVNAVQARAWGDHNAATVALFRATNLAPEPWRSRWLREMDRAWERVVGVCDASASGS